MPATATPTTAYEKALAEVPNAKRTTVPAAKRAAQKTERDRKAAEARKGEAKTKQPKNKWGLRPGDLRAYGTDQAIMSVPCPKCSAKRGAPCTEPAGPRAPHAARVAAHADKKAKTKT